MSRERMPPADRQSWAHTYAGNPWMASECLHTFYCFGAKYFRQTGKGRIDELCSVRRQQAPPHTRFV
jgi:hypothetical protein